MTKNVAPASQNLAMNALIFLYKRVLKLPMDGSINAVRADRKANVPVLMTREEVAAVISLMNGTPQLVTKLLYGSGLRIMEAVRLRVQEVDFGMKVTVRSGKGDKDRITTFPTSVAPLLQSHLSKVRTLHQQDLARGCGEVYLPHALSRKFPNAGKEAKIKRLMRCYSRFMARESCWPKGDRYAKGKAILLPKGLG